jgi:hypothetical protein
LKLEATTVGEAPQAQLPELEEEEEEEPEAREPATTEPATTELWLLVEEWATTVCSLEEWADSLEVWEPDEWDSSAELQKSFQNCSLEEWDWACASSPEPELQKSFQNSSLEDWPASLLPMWRMWPAGHPTELNDSEAEEEIKWDTISAEDSWCPLSLSSSSSSSSVSKKAWPSSWVEVLSEWWAKIDSWWSDEASSWCEDSDSQGNLMWETSKARDSSAEEPDSERLSIAEATTSALDSSAREEWWGCSADSDSQGNLKLEEWLADSWWEEWVEASVSHGNLKLDPLWLEDPVRWEWVDSWGVEDSWWLVDSWWEELEDECLEDSEEAHEWATVSMGRHSVAEDEEPEKMALSKERDSWCDTADDDDEWWAEESSKWNTGSTLEVEEEWWEEDSEWWVELSETAAASELT